MRPRLRPRPNNLASRSHGPRGLNISGLLGQGIELVYSIIVLGRAAKCQISDGWEKHADVACCARTVPYCIVQPYGSARTLRYVYPSMCVPTMRVPVFSVGMRFSVNLLTG